MNKKLLFQLFFSIFFISLYFAGYSQEGSKKDKKVIQSEAQYLYENEMFRQALPLYLKLHEWDPDNDNINLKLAVCYLYSNEEKTKAIPYLQQASKVEGCDPEVHFNLGKSYHYAYRFDSAIAAYQKFINCLPPKGFEPFIKDAERQIEMCNTAKELMASPAQVIMENMGPLINSPYADYVPLINVDESILIFTSRRIGSTGNKTDLEGEYYEDIYFSSRIDTLWTAPVSIGAQINTEKHDATVGLSADGSMLFIYKVGDIYYCKQEGEQWSYPIPFNDNVNTRAWEPSASISADNDVFYFSSDRKGGYGKRDIWRVKKLPTAEWSLAQNLGPTINTIYDEDAPFIHPDSKLLYFSSQGHKSMGGFDVFYCSIDENNTWSKPVNLGYPVNTPDDDIYFVLSGSGEHGYISSIREGGIGEKDIYRITYPGRSIPLTVMRGLILDEVGKPMKAKIVVTDNETGEVIGVYNSNPATGKYIVILPPGKNYNFTIEGGDGYLFSSSNINIPNQQEFVVLEDTIALREIKLGEKTVLRNIFFDYNETELRPESRVELERIFRLMDENAQISIEISGHTDNIGSKKFNQELSEKRAQSVVDYLFERGVHLNRIIGKGYGFAQPVAPNDTEENRQLNRRTEFKIISIDSSLSTIPLPSDTGTTLPILYRVQIAAAKQLISLNSKEFKGVQDIYVDQSDKDLIRYSAGAYSSYEKANEFKLELVNKYNFTDCFVIAYYGNKRITLREAKQLLTKN